MHLCVSASKKERGRERKREGGGGRIYVHVCVYK